MAIARVGQRHKMDIILTIGLLLMTTGLLLFWMSGREDERGAAVAQWLEEIAREE
jgi:hypothetical protein